jgi:hypothetical protein
MRVAKQVALPYLLERLIQPQLGMPICRDAGYCGHRTHKRFAHEPDNSAILIPQFIRADRRSFHRSLDVDAEGILDVLDRAKRKNLPLERHGDDRPRANLLPQPGPDLFSLAGEIVRVAVARAIREARPSSIAFAAPLPITSRTPFPARRRLAVIDRTKGSTESVGLGDAPGITLDTMAVRLSHTKIWASPIWICWTKDRTSSRSSRDASLVQRSASFADRSSTARWVAASRSSGATASLTSTPDAKSRTQTVEHQPFDVGRRNAPAFGMLGATARDKRRRDIVSMPLALLDGMRGR